MSSWYFNRNLKPQGPLSHEDVKKKILRGEISPQDLLCREGELDWREAAEWKEFPRELFPAFQQNYFKKTSVDEAEWILLVFNVQNPHGVQEGPCSLQVILERLKAGTVSLEDYIWRSGLTGWVQIKDRPEFVELLEASI